MTGRAGGRRWRVGPVRAAACLLAGAIAGCRSPADEGVTLPPEAAWLVDEAEERGVQFVLESGARGAWAIPEIMSGGVALFDMENDGDLDLYFVQSGDLENVEGRPGNRLFENLGGGSFRDVSAGSGADDRGWGLGVATGDVDGDGLVDLYVTNLGPNVLLRNRGNGTFEDLTAAAGVGDPGFSTGAAFFDHDADGDLDLFVVNYLDWSLEREQPCFDDRGQRDYCQPDVYEAPAGDRFYRNRGDGRFADASAEVGIADTPGTGLGIVVADLTGDDRLDVFVANDGMPNRLWVDAGDGGFRDEAALRACAVDGGGRPKAGMGVDAADVDGDGDRDLLVGNLKGETDSLFVNEADRFFSEASARYALAAPSRRVTRFGLGFVDFDHDGLLDLLEVAGAVFGPDPVAGYGEPNALLRQGPAGRFVEVAGGLAGGAAVATSRGAAFGDLNGDGWIDAVVVNRDAAAAVFVNQRPGTGESLLVLALDRRGSPALGATVEARIGDRLVRRDVRTAFGYLAAHDPRVHLAYPPGQRPEVIRVRWPGGHGEVFATGTAGVLVAREGTGYSTSNVVSSTGTIPPSTSMVPPV